MAPSFLHSKLDLACEESAVLLARLHAEDMFRVWGLPRDVAYDGRTIVMELTTNAVRHVGNKTRALDPDGRQPQVSVCTLRLWVRNGRLCISMQDESPELPVLRAISETSENGRGLQMIAGLSEGAWGFERTDVHPGKLVWACLFLPSRPLEPKAPPAAKDSSRLVRQSA